MCKDTKVKEPGQLALKRIDFPLRNIGSWCSNQDGYFEILLWVERRSNQKESN